MHGNALQIARRIHGPASVIWLGLLSLHVLVYLGRAVTRAAGDVLPRTRSLTRGATARAYALAAAVTGGLILGAATVPAQHRWVSIRHDHHDRGESGSSSLHPLQQRLGRERRPVRLG